GRPISNARIYILDGRLQPSPVGTVGEIYIGGAGVGRGYLGRPDLTAERFIPLRQEAVRIADCGLRVAEPPTRQPATTSNTWQEEESEIRNPQSAIRVYRTGDVGRWRADGTIEFLGRNDFQVKVRGFRIEPGEIEARLAEHPEVREVVVVARKESAGDRRLVAYYTRTSKNDEGAIDADILRAHLLSRLPEYMAPAAYICLQALPLTPNGKLDRKSLPEPDLHFGANYEAPVGEIEQSLASLWAEVLRIDRVGRHDNFFELGGHSLLAVKLIDRMQEEGLRAD